MCECSRSPRAQDQQKAVVGQIGAVLERWGMEDVNVIATARVPVVKALDPETNTRTDISINNRLAVGWGGVSFATAACTVIAELTKAPVGFFIPRHGACS